MSEIQSQGTTGITKQATPAGTEAAHEIETNLNHAVIAAAAHAEAGAGAEVVIPEDAEIVFTQDETAAASVLILEKPPSGVTETVVWTPGTALVTRFQLDSAVITEEDGATVFTWADGAVLRVVGLDLAAEGTSQIPVTLEDGTVIALDDLAQIAGAAPAAGGDQAPAAGQAPGNQGHAAGPTDPGGIGQGPGDTGPLPYTELAFGVPELVEDTFLLPEEAAPAAGIIISINSVAVTEGDPLSRPIIEGGEGNEGGEGELALLQLQEHYIDDPATTITFTVSLNQASLEPVTVNYTVNPGTALPGWVIQYDGPEGDYSGGGIYGPFLPLPQPNSGGLAKLGEVQVTGSTGYQTGSYTFEEGGTFLLAWSVLNEGDTLVDPNLLLDNIQLNGALIEGFEGGAFLDAGSSAAGTASFQNGAFQGQGPTQGTWQFNLAAGGLTAAQIEAQLGLPEGTLATLAKSGFSDPLTQNPTDGSIYFLEVTVSAGDTITFDYDFINNEISTNFNDFSFFYVDTAGVLDSTYWASTGGVDGLTGTITFAPGETSKTITLEVIDDWNFEPTEQFTVELSDPVGATIGSNPGVGTIFDNDGFLAIQKDAFIGEGDTVATAAGQIIDYTIFVSNTGAGPIADPFVIDPFISDLHEQEVEFEGSFYNSGDTNFNNLLDITEVWIWLGTHEVTQGDMDEGADIVNVATASAPHLNTASDDAVITIQQNPDFAIVKILDPGDQVADEAGEAITYTISFSNTGNVTIHSWVISDPFADDINLVSDGNGDSALDPGETWVYSATHFVTQEEINTDGGGDGFLENVATGFVGDLPPESDDATVPVDRNPDLLITKVVDGVEGSNPDAVTAAGDIIFYTISVENNGNTTLTNVVVTDPNADGISGPSGDDGNGTLDPGETWFYGASHTVTQQELDTNGGGDSDIDNVATADTAETPPESDDASVPIQLALALAVQKDAEVPGGTADQAGEIISYTIFVSNIGNAAISNVQVTDPFASNLQQVLSGGFNVGDVNQNNLLDLTETWEWSANHAVTQQELDDGGTIDNVATATGTNATPGSDDASIPVEQIKILEVIKNASTAGGAITEVGQFISYTIFVSNGGNAAIANVQVTDDFADNLAQVLQLDGVHNIGDINDNFLLDVDEIWQWTADHVVTEGDFENESVVNVATATGDDATPGSDDASVPVNAQPVGGDVMATVFEAGNERVPPAGEPLIFAIGTQEYATPGSGIENANGDLGASFGPEGQNVANPFDWNGTVTAVDPQNGNAPVALSSGGFPVNWQLSGDGMTLTAVISGGPNDGQTVATLTATLNGSNGVNFTYNQVGPFDHQLPGERGLDDLINLGFTYTIRDASGDTAQGDLLVRVGDDTPAGVNSSDELVLDASLEKAESVQSGATGTNMAFVVDVSDSTVNGGTNRLATEIAAVKEVLTQAVANNVLGPVLLVAFHGNWTGGSNVDPRTFFETYASASDALAAIDAFFASLGGPPFGAGNTPPQPGSTRWEGGLEVVADWYSGSLVESLPQYDHLGGGAIINPNSVSLSDNRVFFVTDGGNNNGAGGFTPNAANLPANQQQVPNLYTNVNNLANDIPNLTIRTVAVLVGDQNGNGTADSIEYASIVDQSDDNLINGSATIIANEAQVSDIVAGFGEVESNNTAAGNLFVDDDSLLPPGPGADGIVTVIGADNFKEMQSFTFLNESEELQTVFVTGTYTTFLGGTIEVNFETGDYFYTAPTGSVSGTDHFTYVLLDGDDDPLNGVLNILVGSGGTTADNSGFQTDTLIFWSAAGSVWVSDDSSVPNNDLPDDPYYAVLHTGNSLQTGGAGDNAVLTPDSDRTVYNEATLVNFVNQTGLTSIDAQLQAASPPGYNNMPAFNANATDGAILKGAFDVATPGGNYNVTFDWQFLTNQATNPDSAENDIAFVVIEGQLYMLANSDNVGSPLAAVITGASSPDINIDGQNFVNWTNFQTNTTISVADAGNDGIIHVAFGVMNGGPTANAASALVVDDVTVLPA